MSCISRLPFDFLIYDLAISDLMRLNLIGTPIKMNNHDIAQIAYMHII